MNAPTLGWDLGGAHVKAALAGDRGVERAVQVACPLWRDLDHLRAAMSEAMRLLAPGAARSAVTMTGEVADLFPTRREGVAGIVGVAAEMLGAGRTRFFGADGSLLAADDAVSAWEQVASANWLATAGWLASRLDAGVLVDVGSTTTDIVPLRDGRVAARGRGDFERLACGELLYAGVVRTPVMAVAQSVRFEGRRVRTMAEHFATMADVHRLCGALPEQADQQPAADGGEKTPVASARRLARMIGRDLESADLKAWRRLAASVAARQLGMLRPAVRAVLDREKIGADAPLVGAGCGRFLVERLARRMGRPCRPLSDFVDGGAAAEWMDTCAPAVCLALLARGRGW